MWCGAILAVVLLCFGGIYHFWFSMRITKLFYFNIIWFYISRRTKMIILCRVSFSDPVAVRHSLELISELATKDPYAVAMALGI